MSKLIKEMLDALNAVNQNKTQPFDRQGEVKRIEGKIAWVKLEGSDRETPIQMTIACDVGDTVQARIGGGSAWLTGNLTAPPTDDKKAVEAITMVNNVVQEVQETLEDVSAVDDVSVQYCLSDSSSTFVQYGDWSNTPPTYVSGKYYWTRSVLVDDDGNETYGEPRYSQDTQLSVETDVAFKSNNNHFWHDGSGAYVTTADKSYTSGYATRITSSGILQSYNNNLLSGWTNSGIAFYAGDGTTASNSTTLASFGSTISLGTSNKLEIDSSGISIKAQGTGSLSYLSGGTIFARMHEIAGSTLAGLALYSSYTLSLRGNGYIEFESGTSTSASLMGRMSGSGLQLAAPIRNFQNNKLFTTGTVVATGSVDANATGSGTATASLYGYTPIGILGFEPSGSNYGHLNIYNVSLSGSTVTWRGFNFGTSTASVNMTITVLYVSDTQGI